MAYIHIKLDKIVAGDQKRLFKSFKQLYDKDNELYNYNQKKQPELKKNIKASQNIKLSQIYYGKYSSNLKNNSINSDNFDSQLLQFNSVSPRYITDNKQINTKQYLETNKYYGNIFQSNEYNNLQLIQYFKSIIQTPIDITGVQNVAYLLSPLGTRKNVQINASDFNIYFKNYKIQADYKEHYSDLFKYVLSKSVQCPEKEGIPIYDLNFTDIQTITFQTKQKLEKWLKTYKFDIYLYKDQPISSYITCNINNKFDQYDSINVTKLFQILSLQKYNIFYTNDMKKNIIIDLLDNLNKQSMNCKVSPLGTISKLANQTKSLIINNNLLLNAINPDKDKAIQNLTKQYPDFYTKNTIPNNTLYLVQLLNPLQFDQNNQKNKPSAYFNFVNLKNMQTPLEDFQITIPDIKDPNFNIYGNQKQISAYQNGIFQQNNLSTSIVNLYDIDKTKSLEFNDLNTKIDTVKKGNILHSIPNLYVTSSILEQSIIYDQNYRNNQLLSTDYNNIDQISLKSKVQNYFIPFYQRHIEDNKQYEIGQLNGLRSYLKAGILDDQQNIWLSYKYITSKSDKLEESYYKQYNLPFKIYQIDRLNQHMLQNYLGVLYQGESNLYISKQKGQKCPYKYVNTNYLGCSSLICNADINSKCTGFCTFPTNKEYLKTDIPTGIYWSNNQFIQKTGITNNIKNKFSYNNDNWFYFIPSKQSQSQIYADTDIMVYDDIEIYFSDMEFIKFKEQIDTKGPFYDSIFCGFGHDGNTSYEQYLIKNNENIEKKYNISHKNISAYFQSLENYTKKYIMYNLNTTLESLFDKPLYYFIDKKYIDTLQNKDQYTHIFNKRLLEIFNYSSNKDFLPLLSIKYFYLIDGNQYIKNIDVINKIKKNITYYNLYTENFAIYIQQLVLDEKTGLKLKDMPLSNQIISTNLLYNNFIIAENSPFNGPHKISKNTILNGLIITKDSNNIYKSDIIPKNYFCYIRIVNWWSNFPQCTGKIRVKIDINKKDQTYLKILNTINSYDHIQLIDGFFKSAQIDYKKSNIYSLKVVNSGLNPINDKSLQDFQQCLLLRNYAYLDEQYKQYYQFIDMDKFNQIQIANYDNYNGQPTLIEKLYLTNTKTNIDIVKDFKGYFLHDEKAGCFIIDNNPPNKKNEQNDNNEQTKYFNINNKNNNYKYKESKCYKYIEGQGGIYILNKQKLEKFIKARKDLRQIFQSAIKDSIHKYMPVHTDLWKIIYTGN